MADIVSNLLSKLSERTGREWSIHDIYRLAQKLPEVNSKNITSVLNEISDMGLNVSQEARDQVLSKVKNKDYTGIKNELLNHPVEELELPIECSLDKKEKKAKNKSSKRTKEEYAKVSLHKKSNKRSKSLYHSLKKLSNKKGKKKRV
ncbi:hypothetical protein [Brevibacillus laterosporus]|uniref:Uncharacterized protein n=1 Tax=Brevibacillus laterosporus LMG 15441 TaxID=1042163 RepID=A0A075QWR7_BRELA|nr:hypothetical protein [Brevibacillus laterosporus]HAS00871.1 hypothetical protein [Brevibacillus sp.]AIG24847.1 hypothetical protein BRLA_c004890 [Brevibacillus laterosporus LMG 15441]AUM63493.1 hypothetical protein C0R09_02525 [Brevibacillus laterosporus]AYK06500.1 hypothetical protein D8Z77_09025 [Brevibacillus laterosporus]ERM19741.1 hypothetical protein P615_10360 [Brevibacillus laterosporus PE36]